MTQRMSATERRAQLLTIMQEIHAKAQSQADFTAAKIAQAAGISTVMLYRLVRPEFQTLRSELPGSRHPAECRAFQAAGGRSMPLLHPPAHSGPAGGIRRPPGPK